MSRVDPRLLMSIGLVIVAGATLDRTGFTPSMSFDQFILPQLAFGIGMPLFFVPLMTISVAMVPAAETATAAGLINFLRSMSGAFATAIVTSQWEDQAVRDRALLVGRLDHPADVLTKMSAGGGQVGASLQQLSNLVDNQTVMLATNQTFLYVGAVVACVAVGIWLLPKPNGPVRVSVGH
jgi:DHA2 family multidrug resistance protein